MKKGKEILRLSIGIFLVIFLFKFFDCFSFKFYRSNIVEIAYTISPEFKNNSVTLKIKLEFNLDESGKTNLIVPTKWATRKNIYESIRDLKVYSSSSKTKIAEYKKINQNQVEGYVSGGAYFLPPITARPYEKIFVEYALVPPSQFDQRCPNITKDFFHFVGRTSLVHPNIDIHKKITVIFHWKNFPSDWALGNSYGVSQKKQVLEKKFFYIKEAVYFGGDFRIKKVLCKDRPIFIAQRGLWDFSDEKFSNIIFKIIKVQRAFFNDFDFQYFLVVLLPGKMGFGGDGLYNSFQMVMPQNVAIKDIAWLISHEHFHTWNGKRFDKIKRQAHIKWFTEGFTEYYADLFLLRLGIISFKDYLDAINAKLYDYFTSPVKNKSNATIAKNYHSGLSDDIDRLPYLRGEIFAHFLHTRIKKETQNKYSLDDVMKYIFRYPKKDFDHFSGGIFNGAVKSVCNIDFTNLIETYIEKGETIIPEENTFWSSSKLVFKKMKNVDFGWKTANVDGIKVVAFVDKNSVAYKAGIRKGQVLLEYTCPRRVTCDTFIKVKVKDLDLKTKIIEFCPRGEKSFNVPQFVLET